jgi:uncharacterized membrane protein
MTTIRRDFLYGLFIVVPLASIFWLVELSINVLTGPLSQLLGFELNNTNGILLSLVMLWTIGFIVRQIINRSIFPKIDALIMKVPFLRLIYQSLRQIASVLLKRKQRFLATVFVEYPSKGIWSLGFLTNDQVDCLKNRMGSRLLGKPVAVFIPSTPNPTNGVFVFVDESQIEQSAMSVEDGIKCLMSAGMITPKLGVKQ